MSKRKCFGSASNLQLLAKKIPFQSFSYDFLELRSIKALIMICLSIKLNCLALALVPLDLLYDKGNLVVDSWVARYLDRSRNCRNPGQIPETDPVVVDRPPPPAPGHPDGRKAPVGRIRQGRFWFRTGARSGKFRNDKGSALRLRFHRRNLSRPGKGSVRSVHQRPVPGRRKFRIFIVACIVTQLPLPKNPFPPKWEPLVLNDSTASFWVSNFFRKLVL